MLESKRITIVYFVCLGSQRTELSLLGSVRRSRGFWCRCICFQVPSSSHRGAASGGAGDPSESFLTAAHLSGWGDHPPSPPPRRRLLAARSVQSRVSPGGCGGSGLSEHHDPALLHGEEDQTGESGGGGYWERLQGDGESVRWNGH